MRKILDYQGVYIYDDVLSPEDFNRLFHLMQQGIQYLSLGAHRYTSVWEPTDSQILRGEQKVVDLHHIPNDFLSVLLNPIAEAIKHTGIQGAKSLVMLPHCYPPGTSIKWHTDENYLGAATYYLHRKWNSEWGGEFLHLNEENPKLENTTYYMFVDNEDISDSIVNNGVGVWAAPKPNRLVINESGEWHKVVRSTPNANYRFTIQSFIVDKTPEELRSNPGVY